VKLANWSLRARLLAELLALLAGVCLIIGVASELALREYLVDQLDGRLTAASQRLGEGRPPRGSPPPRQNDDRLQGVGTEVGTLSAQIAGGKVVGAGYLDRSARPQPLPSQYAEQLLALPADNRPRTVSLGELGEYRMVASRGPSDTTLITGLPLADVNATLWQLGLSVAGVSLGALLIAGATGALIVGGTLRPLRRVADTASRVAELPLDRGEVALSVRVPEQDTNPRTEVGKVGNALNRMLGHVGAALAARQASETRVRQFVADASHELRTPLAAIRGYAELTRRGNQQVPPDVAHALRRVESESDRMAVLVDDLLLLARLDAADAVSDNGDAALAREPVDLSALVVNAVSDAHVAGPQHRWQLDLPEESLTVLGDEVRLHHVLGNLLANARTHTPAGTTVTVRLYSDGRDAVLSVTDDGPGIPPELLPQIFDRFARGDTSRSRAAGSTGLGLAIVQAVVHAQHGTVEASSEPGRTTFTVRLPLAAR
jgi:two-component system, OmpR family, sensor kinase